MEAHFLDVGRQQHERVERRVVHAGRARGPVHRVRTHDDGASRVGEVAVEELKGVPPLGIDFRESLERAQEPTNVQSHTRVR